MNQPLNNPFANVTPPTRQVQHFPQQPQYQPVMAQQPEPKKKSKKKYLLILLLLLLLIPTIWLFKEAFIGDIGTPTFPGIKRIEKQSAGDWEFKSTGERVAALNETIQEGMIHIKVNTSPIFETGTSEGTLMIYNRSINRYPQLIEIYTKHDKTLLFSGVLDIGYKVETAKLLVDLPAGEYDCVVYGSNIDPETGENLGTAGVDIKITVLN